MRFLPLLSSAADPGAWRGFPAVELRWDHDLHPGWARSGLAVHALHLPSQTWEPALVLEAVTALRAGLGPDFLVLHAHAPGDRTEQARFLGTLEALLEAVSGRAKVALRPGPDAAALAALMKEARCDAVGYCWDDGVGEELDAISDRLYCAVGTEGGHYTALQRLGYRWNMAIPASDPEVCVRALAALEVAHPMIYFPEVAP